jgi:hypothetical protein
MSITVSSREHCAHNFQPMPDDYEFEVLSIDPRIVIAPSDPHPIQAPFDGWSLAPVLFRDFDGGDHLAFVCQSR